MLTQTPELGDSVKAEQVLTRTYCCIFQVLFPDRKKKQQAVNNSEITKSCMYSTVIIPEIKPSNWELVLYLPWNCDPLLEITEKRKLFKLILNMIPFISNTKFAFELSHSFPLCLHIYICKLLCWFPFSEYTTYLWNSWQALGGCRPDSCAISWVNQLIKETKRMQKLLKRCQFTMLFSTSVSKKAQQAEDGIKVLVNLGTNYCQNDNDASFIQALIWNSMVFVLTYAS